MKGKKGAFDTYYNVQAACGEDQIITFCDVVLNGNDKTQLIPALQGITNNTGKAVEKALADADYGTLNSYEYMEQNHIEGYVPYRDMNATFEDKPFHSSHFIYDKENDCYICPNKEQLVFYRIRTKQKRQQTFRCYRTNGCKQCPFQKQCCRSGLARRVIEREVRQHLREQMKQRLNSPKGKEVYLKRLHPIESLFGQLKYNLKYTHFLLRGLQKVKAEFTLMCLCYNLRKLIAKKRCFLLSYDYHLPFVSKKSLFFGFPRFVNELLLNTLKISVMSLHMTAYLKVFCGFHSRSPCKAMDEKKAEI